MPENTARGTAPFFLLLLLLLLLAGAAFAMPGDQDGDTDVDTDDILIILAARNTPAAGPSDPRDLDADGVITVLDARIAATLCTRSLCVPGNNAPTVAAPGDQTVLEDGTTGALPVTVGDPDIGADPNTLVLTATSSDQTLVPDANLTLGGSGTARTIDVAPAADENGGPVTITLTVSDGIDTAMDTFTVTVTPVNDAPSFTVGPDQTVLEDDGLQTAPGWATAISAGPADEAGQTLTFNVTGNTNPGLFDAAPTLNSSGDLTYSVAPEVNGSATITVELMDDGGTADGGADTSAPQTFTINVTPVNDEPSFSVGPDQNVLEDAGAQTVSGWATGISAGPADEAGQTLTFNVVGNTNAALFSAGPSVDGVTGDLTYTPAPDLNGSATITLELMDDGGTADGGTDTSPPQNVIITVGPVNDVPSFSVPASHTSAEDDGPITAAAFATAISAGPANESAQNVTFTITGNTNAGLFSTAPSLSSTGTLTYEAAANANGSATITVELMDDGGTADGGVDTSAPQSFDIVVSAVDDPPTAVLDMATVTEDDAATAVPVLANDVDIDGGPISVASVTQPANGTVIITGGGSGLTYQPDPNYCNTPPGTTDDFTYALAPGGSSAPVQVTVTCVNDAPALDLDSTDATAPGLDFATTFTEGGAPALLQDPANETLTDVDDTNLESATIILTNPVDLNLGGGTTEELLSVDPSTVSPNTAIVIDAVRNGSTPIDNFPDAPTIELHLSGTATVAEYLAALNTITYQNTSLSPDVTPRVVTFVANDGDIDSATATATVAITAVNDPPVLDPIGAQSGDELTPITFTATATDPDTADTLTFTLADGTGSVPTGAAIDPNTGLFTFTPTEAQDGAHTFDVVVTDDGTNPANLTDSETITVTVNDVNTAPTLDPIGAQSGDEGSLITFTATASDGDTPAQTLTFSLAAGGGAVPAGAFINPNTGVFTFTPAEDQQGPHTFDVVVTDDGTNPANLSDSETITVTVNEVNEPPVLAPIGAQSGDELTPITFTATATDPDLPANTLTFSLADGTGGSVPAGASITAGGVFTFTPTEAQGPGTYTFDVVVTDDGTGPPNLSDSETITVTVNDVNVAPVLDPVGAQSGDELTSITFTATASDTDEPTQTLTFSLANGTGSVPSGASITAGGLFTFTPTEAQGPGTYTFDVVVTDDGTNPANLTDTETITVTVNEVNVAPVLTPIGNPTPVDEMALLSFTATATDADVPANTLTFTLANGTAGSVPTGASITAGGMFTWTPTEAQGPGTYTFDVVVTDDGSPAMNDFETIMVTVNEVNNPPVVTGEAYQAVTNTALEVNNTAAAAQPSVFVMGDVLDNDTDGGDGPAGLTAALVSGSVSPGASVAMNPDGTFTYTPPAGQTTNDTFMYNVSDGADMVAGTVTISFVGRVWYVDNMSGGADEGTSTNPFLTLAQAETASSAGDTIFVYRGNGTTAGQDTGIVLQSMQSFLGEGVDLELNVALNGGTAPTLLFDSAANLPAVIEHTAGNGVTVNATAGDQTGLEIRGFTISGSDNAIDVRATGANQVGLVIADNAFANSGNEAIDLDPESSGSFMAVVEDNTFSTSSPTGNAIDVTTAATAGTVEVAINNNVDITSSAGDGIHLDGSAGGSLYVSGFSGNSVHGNTGGAGIWINGVIFDADGGADADFTGDTVNAGATSVGDAGNPVSGDAMRLANVTGDLAFTQLDLYTDGATSAALVASASAELDAAAGTGFGLASSSGTVTSATGTALDLDPLTAGLTLTTLSGTNVALTDVAGSVVAQGGLLAPSTAVPTFLVDGGSVSTTYSGSLAQAQNAALVEVTGNHTVGTVLFQTGTLDATNGTGLQFSNADGTYDFTGAVTLNGGDAGIDILATSMGSFTFTNTSITSPSTGPAFLLQDSTVSVTYSGGTITQASNLPAVQVLNGGNAPFNFGGTINATDGTGLQFSNADGTYNFNTMFGSTTLNGGDAGIDILAGSDGTFTFGSATIMNPSGIAFLVSSNAASVNYTGGSITQNNAAQAVRVFNGTGVLDFDVPIVASTGGANAIDLPGFNSVRFDGGLTLNTTTGQGLLATSGTSLEITGTNNVDSDTGRALFLQSVAVGPAGVTFASVDKNGTAGTVDGITLDVVSGSALNIGSSIINGTSGAAGNRGIEVSNSSAPITITSVDIDQTAGEGILLTSNTGSFTVTGGSIGATTSPTGDGVGISGGTGTVSIGATITQTGTNNSVDVQTRMGGTVTFSGAIDDDAGGIFLDSNAGGTITFQGGMALDTGANTAFTATGGGTVNVCATSNCAAGAAVVNTIGDATALSGQAVNISSTDIGSSGVTFRSIDVSGGGASTVPAINLSATGTGTFTVTGIGSTGGSGGTIEDILEDAVRLFNTDGAVSFSNVVIEDIGDTGVAAPGHHAFDGQQVDGGLVLDNIAVRRVTDSAIHGETPAGGSTTWNGLTLTDSELIHSNRFHVAGVADGGATDEMMVTIEGISGTVLITGNDFDLGPGFVNLLTAGSGTVDITVQNNTFDEGRKDLAGQASVGSSGVRVNTRGTIDADIRIGDPAEASAALGNTFVNAGSDAAIFIGGFSASDNATVDLVISRNTSTVTDHTSPPGLCPAGGGIGACAFDFPNGGIGVESRGTGDFEAIISQNTLVETQNSGGLSTGSLRVDVSGDQTEVIVRNNTLTRSWDAPLFIRGDNLDNTGADGQLLIQNNTYNAGTIGVFGSGDDLDTFGFANSPAPFSPNRYQARNGVFLELTIDDDDMVLHDTFSNSQFGSHDLLVNGDVVGGGGSVTTFNVLIRQSTGPYVTRGFRFRNDDHGVDATNSALNLSRGASAVGAASDINSVQAQVVLDGNTNVGTADVQFTGTNIVTSTPMEPMVSPP